jgi:hypothetical protein
MCALRALLQGRLWWLGSKEQAALGVRLQNSERFGFVCRPTAAVRHTQGRTLRIGARGSKL